MAALDNNLLGGSLPESWGLAGAFPKLQELYLPNTSLAGTLPETWGNDGVRGNPLSPFLTCCSCGVEI